MSMSCLDEADDLPEYEIVKDEFRRLDIAHLQLRKELKEAEPALRSDPANEDLKIRITFSGISHNKPLDRGIFLKLINILIYLFLNFLILKVLSNPVSGNFVGNCGLWFFIKDLNDVISEAGFYNTADFTRL